MGKVKDELGRMSRADAAPYVDEISEFFTEMGYEFHLVGSWRRQTPTIGDLDILIMEESPADVPWPDHFHSYRAGASLSSGVWEGRLQVDLWQVEQPSQLGAFLWFATGPQSLNIRMRAQAMQQRKILSQYGVFDKGSGNQLDDGTERGVAQELGLPWIPPEERR